MKHGTMELVICNGMCHIIFSSTVLIRQGTREPVLEII
jgi:hypothetical protein